MVIILSPSKTISYNNSFEVNKNSTPVFLQKADVLANIIKKYSAPQLANIMNISADLANLTYQRYLEWNIGNVKTKGRPAVFSFKGEAFIGLAAESFTNNQLFFAQNNLLILSGLYGVLRPLDSMLPYRLEMACKILDSQYQNLYKYWKTDISNYINETVNKTTSKTLVNLASDEYYKVIDTKNIDVITPVFKDYSNGQYKIKTVYAKRARGAMASFIIKNNITNPENLKTFDNDGYYYNQKLSSNKQWVFTRG